MNSTHVISSVLLAATFFVSPIVLRAQAERIYLPICEFQFLDEELVKRLGRAWKGGGATLVPDGISKVLELRIAKNPSETRNKTATFSRAFRRSSGKQSGFEVEWSLSGYRARFGIESAEGKTYWSGWISGSASVQTNLFSFDEKSFPDLKSVPDLSPKFFETLKGVAVVIVENKPGEGAAVLLKEIRSVLEGPLEYETVQLLALPFPTEGGVAYPGEARGYKVWIENWSEREKDFVVELYETNDSGIGRSERSPLRISGRTGTWKEFSTKSEGPGFFSAMLVLKEKSGRRLLSRPSANAVVRPLPNFGRDDRESFFGSMRNWDLPAAAEKIGVKFGRPFAWMGDIPKDRKMDDVWKGTDRLLEVMKKHHQLSFLGIHPRVPPPSYSGYKWKTYAELVASEEGLEEWRSFVRDTVLRYRDRILAVDLINEPDLDIWRHYPDLSLDEAAKIYATLVREGYRASKEAAPEIPVAALGVSANDVNILSVNNNRSAGDYEFTKAVLPLIKDSMDIFSGHSYSSFRTWAPGIRPQTPEEQNLQGRLKRGIDLISEAGFPRRFWIGEIGWNYRGIKGLLDTHIFGYADSTAQGLITAKSVPEIERTTWFAMNWKINPYNGYYDLFWRQKPYLVYAPTPAVSAFASTAHFLHGLKPAGEVSIDPLLRIFLFEDEKEGRAAATLWSRTAVDLDVRADMPRDAALYSLFGKKIAGGGVIRQTVGESVVFVEAKYSDRAALRAGLEKAKVSAKDPIRVSKAYFHSVSLAKIEFKNILGEGKNIEIAFPGGKTVLNVAPLTNTVAEIQVKGLGSGAWLFEYGVKDEAKTKSEVSADFLKLPKIVSPRIDGELSETDGLFEVDIGSRDHLFPDDAAWRGKGDLSPRAFWGWNEMGLYLAFSVKDDIHVCGEVNGNNYYNSDSIQIGLDIEGDSIGSYDSGDREIGLAISSKGPLVFVYGVKTSVPKNAFGGIRKGDETTYEALIPWETLQIEAPKGGKVIAMSFIVNENDGQGRAHFMGLTPGIGETKAPRYYKRFVLEE